MRIQRLDLGIDIVVVPEEDLVILHPDLSFGQAVGAVMAVLPHMHPDAVVNLVSQVTQRPPRASRPVSLLAAVPVLALLLVAVATSASASPQPYDHRWKDATAAMQMRCDRADRGRTCLSRDGTRYQVTAYTRDDGALYILRSTGERRYLRAFTGAIPRDWLDQNPNAAVVDTSAAIWE
jgi:hypothetical protein